MLVSSFIFCDLNALIAQSGTVHVAHLTAQAT